jgi:predicted nucleic acid-binding protein
LPIYYLETSALMKKYRTEKRIELIEELFEGKIESEVFITSYLTMVEITSVTARLLRARTLTRDAYQVILGNLAQDLRTQIQMHSISDSVLEEAVGLTIEYALRAPDAIHLAAALSSSSAVPDEDFYFVASDVRLKKLASNLVFQSLTQR